MLVLLYNFPYSSLMQTIKKVFWRFLPFSLGYFLIIGVALAIKTSKPLVDPYMGVIPDPLDFLFKVGLSALVGIGITIVFIPVGYLLMRLKGDIP